MKKRMIVMLAAVGVFIGLIGFVKFMQIRAAIAQGASWQPPPEAVTTAVAERALWPSTLSAIGTVVAVHGVTVSADLPGIVERIAFESGRAVRSGQVLVQLDTRQEQAQLAAAKAQLDLDGLTFDRARGLLDRGVISQAEFDRAQAQLKQSQAKVGEIQATIERKIIRAPFSGVAGIRQVNLGQFLAGGDPVVPVQSLDPVYVNFDLPQQNVGELRVGSEVQVAAESIAVSKPRGRITALNSVVDPTTRNVQVQATFENPRAHLRPGMFVEVQVVLGAENPVISLPASAISYAPYGNSVFVVGNMKDPKGRSYRGVEQRFVKIGGGRGDQIAILTGVKPGDEVVTSGVFKLRNGAAVLVNNKVQPSNSPAPRPEDS